MQIEKETSFDLIGGKVMIFVSLAEAAVAWRVPVGVLREMCEKKMIDGAVRFGRIWALPESVCELEFLQLCRPLAG